MAILDGLLGVVLADALLPARNQMAISLGWHIILACFGMAMPAMIFVLHRRGLRGDDDALELAKRWSKVAGVLFAIGAVSGTILSFELGLLWPVLMERFGDVVGLAFALEGISFFTEAIFLGIYVYGWGRIPGRIHSLMLLPMIASGVTGSFFVISVNAWMNAPTGFDMVDGEVVDVRPVEAIFNSAVGLQFLHMFLAAYMVAGFVTAAVYAFAWSKGKTDRYHRLGIVVPLAFAGVAALMQPMVGHLAGQRVADRQPIKLAAMEAQAETERSARLTLGGVYLDGELRGELEIPIDGLASFLAQNDFDAEIVGLDATDDPPPVNIVRTSFQLMVALGTALAALVTWVLFRWWRHRERVFDNRWLIRALVAAGPAAVVAMEAGWVTTEVGRQPWIVHEVLLTEDAVTTVDYLWITLSVIVVVYAAMTIGAIGVVRSMTNRWAAGEKDIATPYGPPEDKRPGEPRLADVEARRVTVPDRVER